VIVFAVALGVGLFFGYYPARRLLSGPACGPHATAVAMRYD